MVKIFKFIPENIRIFPDNISDLIQLIICSLSYHIYTKIKISKINK